MTDLIAQFRQKKAEYDSFVSKHGQEALLDGFRKLFEACPTLEAVRWRQYTPSFNDGDPCVFRLGDAYLKITGLPEDGGDYDDGFYSYYGLWRPTPEEEARDRELKALWETVYTELSQRQLFSRELEDIFNVSFGDPMRVTVYRDLRTETEYYDHG